MTTREVNVKNLGRLQYRMESHKVGCFDGILGHVGSNSLSQRFDFLQSHSISIGSVAALWAVFIRIVLLKTITLFFSG